MTIAPRWVGIGVALITALLLAGPIVVIRNRSDDNRHLNKRLCHEVAVQQSLLRSAVEQSLAAASANGNQPFIDAYEHDLTLIDRTVPC